jgi:predicted ester cyclase
MSAQKNLSIAREMYDNYNRRDFKAAVRNIDKNAELKVIPQNLTLTGQEGYTKFLETWDKGFPDSKAEIKNIYGGEDFVVCEFTGRGTNTGPLMFEDNEIMPTGKKVEINFVDIINFKNEKIVRVRTYYDTTSMLRQLDLLPELKHHS